MKSVLIVEDEQALRDAYALLFDMSDYKVLQAANGREALAVLEDEMPDYIVLDILMPVMGGIEFLKAARLPEQYPDTKVLVLSNLSDSKTVETITRLGASQYRLKASMSPRELLDAIEAL